LFNVHDASQYNDFEALMTVIPSKGRLLFSFSVSELVLVFSLEKYCSACLLCIDIANAGSSIIEVTTFNVTKGRGVYLFFIVKQT
jgi:hypothetical protein